MIFICFAIFLQSHKSQKVFCHSVWFFSVKWPICFSMTENFCCFLAKWQLAENFLPVSQISFHKTAIIFHYDRKCITSSFLWFLLPSYKVTSHRKFSAILFLQISFCVLKYFCALGSNTIINVVSVRNTLNLGDLLRKPVILIKNLSIKLIFILNFMVANTALSQKFFDLYPRIPERLELFPGLDWKY